MARRKSPSRAPAALSQQAIDAKTVLPRSRYLVYAALAVVTWLITFFHFVGTLPQPIGDWAAWEASGAASQLVGATLFSGIFICFEFVIASTIYLRVAQKRASGAIAQEVAGEVLEMVVEAVASGSSGGGKSSGSSSGGGFSGGGGSSGGGGASGNF